MRVKNNEPHAENEVIYQLTDSDYDKLCKAIVPKFEAFPEGCYVSDVDSDWKVYVEYENGEPWFDIQHYNKSMMKVFPDHTDTYGLVKKETQTEMTLRYFGNGVLNIEPTRTSFGFMGDFLWKGKAEDIVEDDEMLQANYSSELLGSFVIEKTAVGYEAHSPLTDIYIKFTEDDHSQLFLCRKNASGGTDEYIYDYLGGFYPYNTSIELYDVTGDGTDDLILSTYYTGTGVVDSGIIFIDGKSMEEIPIYRIGAEKMIAEISEELLEGKEFTARPNYLSANMPELEYEYIYPYYPDKSVQRYGGMAYGFYNGKLTSTATFEFIRNDSEYSEIYHAEFEFEYVDGVFMPVSMELYNEEEVAQEEQEQPDLTICTNYLNDYWNYLFKTGEFSPEEYISDADMLALANKRKLAVEDTLGHGIENVEVIIDSDTVQSGTNSEGKKWLCFVYDLQRNLEDGTSTTEYYQGYTAYFELDSDGRIFREYQLYGTEKEVLGLDDNYTLPLGNTDIHAAIDSITEELAPEKINPKPYTITSQVYKAEEHGYSPDNDNNTQLEISFELPENWDFGGCTADLNGSKIFEIGVPYPESQGINYDNFKTDQVVGREITVYGEKVGTDSDPFEYYINTSSPDYYSDDGTYDMYGFVVNSGGYNLYMHFVADAGVEYAVFEQVLRSVTIRELPPAVESNPVADPDYIPDADEVFHTAVNPEGTAYNIQFEKLAGTEDAKDLNKYKNEILTCINKSISAVSDDNIRPMKISDIDFNNEELVQGVKIHGVYSDYSPNAGYDKVMSALESESFKWEILIQNEYTGAKLSIHHCNNDKCPGYRFGDDWCIQLCDTSRATSKTHSTAADLYAEYAAAEDILNKYVKANKNDDIKVVYASIGRPLVSYYLNGGIVFINGVAKYIYSSGFAVHYDRMKAETPEDIVQKMTSFDDLYLVRSSIAGSTDYEGIFSYNEVMSVINVYEKYSMYTE